MWSGPTPVPNFLLDILFVAIPVYTSSWPLVVATSPCLRPGEPGNARGLNPSTATTAVAFLRQALTTRICFLIPTPRVQRQWANPGAPGDVRCRYQRAHYWCWRPHKCAVSSYQRLISCRPCPVMLIRDAYPDEERGSEPNARTDRSTDQPDLHSF